MIKTIICVFCFFSLLSVHAVSTISNTDYKNIEYKEFLSYKFSDKESIHTYPLIYKDRLFVLSSYVDLKDFSNAQSYLILYSFDLKNNLALLWKKQISKNAAVGPQFNLIPVEDGSLAIFTSYKPGGVFTYDVNHQLTLVDFESGDIRKQHGMSTKWYYKSCDGRFKDVPNSAHYNGVLYEFGDFIYSSVSGTTPSKCKMDILMSDIKNHWVASHKEPVVINDKLFTYLTTTDYDKTIDDFAAVSFPIAKDKKIGCDVNAIKYRISFQKERKYKKTGHFAVYKNSLYFPLLNNNKEFVLSRYNAKTGSFLEEIVIDSDMDEALSGIEHSYVVIVDDVAYIHNGFSLYVVSIKDQMTLEKKVVAQTDAIVGTLGFFNSFATKDYFYLFGASCINKCESPYLPEHVFGKTISQFDIKTGELTKRYTAHDFKNEVLIGHGIETSNADTVTSKFLLFYNNTFITITSAKPTQSTLYSIPLPENDKTLIKKLQYRFNNSANQIVDTSTEGSAQNTSLVLTNTDDEANVDYPVTGDPLQSAGPDLSVDKGPENYLKYTFYEMDKLESAYIPLLSKVKFSGNGDPSNNGEGKIKVRSVFGCNKVNLTYPSYLELNLYEYPTILDIESADKFLTFRPNMPMFYGQIGNELSQSNRKLLLSYSAYENDTTTVIDNLFEYSVDAMMFALSVYTGNVCGMVKSLGNVANSAVSSEDEYFGSPHLYLLPSEDTSNLYGLTANTNKTVYNIAASQNQASMQTFVNTASTLANLACMEVGTSATASENFKYANVAGSLLLDKDNRYTEGVISLNRRHQIPVKSVKIVLEKIEKLRDQTNPVVPMNVFTTRIGVLGNDEVRGFKADIGDSVNPFDTPYMHYVKAKEFNMNMFNANKETVLYNTTFKIKEGTAGIYIEVGQSINGGFLALYSDTKFFEEILYGAWDEVDLKKKKFSKKIVKLFNSPQLEGYFHLRLEAELGEIPEKPLREMKDKKASASLSGNCSAY